MGLIQKISDWYNRHRFARAITMGVPILSAADAALEEFINPTVAVADHYDGYPSPSDIQLDNRVIYDRGNVSLLLIPRFFPNKYLIVAPIHISKDGVGDHYVNVGRFFTNDKRSIAATLGIGYSGGALINPQLYATFQEGRFIFDPHVQYWIKAS